MFALDELKFVRTKAERTSWIHVTHCNVVQSLKSMKQHC